MGALQRICSHTSGLPRFSKCHHRILEDHVSQTNHLPLVEEDLLQKTDFLLITSSSLDRFARIAKQAAAQSQLHQNIKSGTISLTTILARTEHLYSELAICQQSDVQEAELAILLSVLAATGDLKSQQLILHIANTDTAPGARWIRALAILLWQEKKETLISYEAANRRIKTSANSTLIKEAA